MFKVIEYKRARSTKAKVAKFVRRKVIREFETLDAARKFCEGKPQVVIQYPRSYMKEMSA